MTNSRSENILTIKQVQNRLLEMGKTVCDILSKNNIPYMIAFGTLLGAVRHKGFIPWDDDFDLYLFDSSYEKALDALRKELPKDMFVEYFDSEKKFFHAWARVKDRTTICDYDMFPQDGIYACKGLNVDMYRLAEIEESEVDLYRYNENKKYQRRRLNVGIIDRATFDLKVKELDKLIEQEKKKKAECSDEIVYATMLSERYYNREMLLPFKKYKFENFEFFGPNDYDKVLKRLYGEYMKLPKVEDRKPHYKKVIKIC